MKKETKMFKVTRLKSEEAGVHLGVAMKKWPLSKLCDVSVINYGYTESASFEDVGPHFLRITDIQDDHVEWRRVPYCKISGGDLAKYRLASGDLVFARTGATTGKSFLLVDPPEAVFASYLIRLRLLGKALLPEFVALFFQTHGYWKSIKEGSAGSAQGGFNASKLGALLIPIPPLAEQQRIVGLLDEAFEGLATAKANAEKNLANARSLFESHLQSVFTQRGEGWVEKKLEMVLDVQPQNGWSPPAAHHSDSGTPVLTLSSVTGFHFKPTKIKFTSAPTSANRSYWVKNGDFLITRSNTPMLVGHVAIAKGIEAPTIYPDLIMRMKPASNLMLSEFLYYQMRTPALRKEIMGRAQGANPTMKKISNGAVKTLPIVVPPITTQHDIVATLAALTEETQRLECLYQQKLAAVMPH